MLRIEVDGQFHGGPPLKPWVARLLGPDAKFGLAREFVQPMRDWAKAHRAWSGNLYGVIATYPLRSDNMYEVCRPAGTASKRHLTREFHWLARGELNRRTVEDVLRWSAPDTHQGTILRVREIPDRTLVSNMTAAHETVGFAVVGTERVYFLREGHVYDVRDVDRRDQDRSRMLQVVDGQLESHRVKSWPSATLR